MIINDTCQFVFVHIPKCAGTFVRQYIQPYDETGGAFTSRVAEHPALGLIDFVHMPLFTLREHFPQEYQKICSYRAFALVRDPVQRFPSSMAEFLKLKARPIKHVETSELIMEVKSVIRFLSDHDAEEALLPHEYIHFQRQADYVYDNGNCLINNVYPVENVHDLLVDAGRILGRRLQPQQDGGWKNPNQSVVYRHPWVHRLVELARPVATRCLKPILSESVKNWIRHRIYVPRQERFAEVFQSDEIKRFIKDYYQADFELYQAFSTK
jgi:hypothetical protein